MRKYEAMYIIRPTLEEEAVKAVIERFSNLVTEQGGQVEKVDEWGKRRMAYEINDFKEGFYVLMHFDAEPSVPQELERVFKITDDIVRYMVIREDE